MLDVATSNDREKVKQQTQRAQLEELAHYTGRIEEIFAQTDPKGQGYFSSNALAQIIRDFYGDCSQEDVDLVLRALDKGDGYVRHADFLEWLMEEESPSHRTQLVQDLGNAFDAADGGGEGEEEAADEGEGMDMTAMEEEAELPPLIVDLAQQVQEAVWPLVAARMGLDKVEASEAYRLAKTASGGAVAMKHLLKALGIDSTEREGLENFMTALEAGRADYAKVQAGKRPSFEFQADYSAQGLEMTVFDKVVRELDKAKESPERAWDFVTEGRVIMARAEEKVAESFRDRVDEFIERVRQYSIEPPMLNATAGQLVVAERCTAEVEAIIERCRSQGVKYTDTDWDMQHNSPSVFYVDHQEPGYDCTVGKPAGYERLSEIVRNSGTSTNKALSSLFGGMAARGPAPERKPILFKDGIQAGDIVQGNIGTCFLLGAIGAIASKEDGAIEKMFIKWDIDVGVFGIRLNVNGEWTYVIVDEYMPVDANGELMYGRCKDSQEVWVPLLEKAFCKLNTCYEMCDGGLASEAIAGFMGGVGGRFVVKKTHRRDPARYFKVLKQAKDRGWLLTTGFVPRRGGSAGAGKCGEAVLPTGLVCGHAYSVLKVVEAHGNMLVCCMNPWGSGEWTGKWSDANAHGEWTPEMREATGAGLKDDGKFWMSIADFVANTAGVDYARTFGPNWKKVTQYTHFQVHALTATAMWDYQARDDKEINLAKGDQVEVETFTSSWWTGSVRGKKGFFPSNYVELNQRPVARFDLRCTKAPGAKDEITAVVMLIQPNALIQRRWYKRKEDDLNYKDTSYPFVQLIVLNPDGDVAIKREAPKRCIWGELKLPGGGLWKIYALASDGNGSSFSLRVHLKNGTGALREIKGADIRELAGKL